MVMTAEERAVCTDVYRPRGPLDLRSTVAPLAYGGQDPSMMFTADGFWRTLLTPEGPATLRVQSGAGADRGAYRVSAWGPGGRWAADSVPRMLGQDDDWSGLDLSTQPALAEVMRTNPGIRLPSTGLVFAALVAAIFEQKTTGLQAHRSWRYLLARYGSTPPGPAPSGMRVPPTPEQWRLIPSWAWHRAGVEPAQSKTAVRAAFSAAAVDRLSAIAVSDPSVQRGLCSIPGVGAWTAAETTQRSHGDPDSVSVGDYHLASAVGWAFVGKSVDDDGMLEILEPWRGHRQRVVRLLFLSGFRKPRFGPRITIQDHRRN